MSQLNPWYTSNDLIEAVKRKISMPIYQSTFNPQDILDFASEAMMATEVPAVLQYHEEYYVYKTEVPIVKGQKRYDIPERAIGMKLRDIFYKDLEGHFVELTRAFPVSQIINRVEVRTSTYYIEGNEIVLIDDHLEVGSLMFTYFLRPSRLVLNERSVFIDSFFRGVTLNHAQLSVSPSILYLGTNSFTSTTNPSPSAGEFYIGSSSIQAATNLAALINTTEFATGDSGSPSTDTVNIFTEDLKLAIKIDGNGMVASTNVGLKMTTDLPSNIAANTKIDMLQTRPGHRLKAMSVKLKASNISTNAIVLPQSVVPLDMVAGDNICSENECIIPMLPTDLHTTLAERTCAAMLAAQGDIQGLSVTNGIIAEAKKGHDTMLNNRVEGSANRIIPRNGFLRKNKGYRRLL